MEDLSPDLHQMDENFTLVKKAKNLTFADWMIDDDSKLHTLAYLSSNSFEAFIKHFLLIVIDSFYKGKVNENDELTKDNFRIFAGKREFMSTLSNKISIRITK